MAEESKLAEPGAEQVRPAEHTRSADHFRPNVDILEKEHELLVLADVPGAASDKIDIDFEDGALSLHARVEPRQAAETQYLLREYGTGDYCRTFRVSEAIDAEKIAAEYANGVLTLHLPKAEAARPRKITVNTNSE